MQCVTTETRILTDRGWLTHDDVRIGDRTIGYNPATGRSEWTRITKVVHYDDAPVWRIGHRNWHADVTPNHRWFSDTEVPVTRDADGVPGVRPLVLPSWGIDPSWPCAWLPNYAGDDVPGRVRPAPTN